MRCCLRFFLSLYALTSSFVTSAQQENRGIEIYGFIMLDGGYNFNSMDPKWFDVMRPTKLPAAKNEYGPSGNIFYGMRQTRLGFNATLATQLGDLKAKIEFDMFGFGADAGQTTFHLIQAYAELGKIRVGQTPSVFMDIDVVPLTLDYWGPCSRNFNFNIQFRYTPVQTSKGRLAFALERPGGTADNSDYREFLDLENVRPEFPVPNFTMHYKCITSWGHVQAGGLLKLMKWHDTSGGVPYDLSGHDLGWGTNISALIRTSELLLFKMQAVYGEGIQNYFADAPADVGVQSNDDPVEPIKGKALPIGGLYVFSEWKWSKSLASTLGYGWELVENSNLQSSSAFHQGQYGLVNLRYFPTDRVMAGIEFQYGRRDNNTGGFYSVGNKIQASFKFNFSSGELTN